jgi:heme A synthase
MNFGSIMIKTLVVLVVLFCLSLTGAITFPITTAITNGTSSGITSILLFIVAVLLLSIIGYLLAKGVKSVKKSGEGILLGFVGALAMGGILAIFTQLNIPYTVTVNLNWTGTSWYSPFLTILFIGLPLMFVFLIGD